MSVRRMGSLSLPRGSLSPASNKGHTRSGASILSVYNSTYSFVDRVVSCYPFMRLLLLAFVCVGFGGGISGVLLNCLDYAHE